MRKSFEKLKTLSVHMEEREYKWVELQARGSVSSWARGILLAGMPSESTGAVEGVQFSSLPNPIARKTEKLENESISAAPKQKTCPHGKAKDYYCGMCQGKANVE